MIPKTPINCQSPPSAKLASPLRQLVYSTVVCAVAAGAAASAAAAAASAIVVVVVVVVVVVALASLQECMALSFYCHVSGLGHWRS